MIDSIEDHLKVNKNSTAIFLIFNRISNQFQLGSEWLIYFFEIHIVIYR